MSLKGLSDQQVVEQIEAQEARLVFDSFSISQAHEIGLRLLELGRQRTLPIAIDVTRNGQCLFHSALEGATLDNAQWVQRKMRVVQRFSHSSLYMGALCRVKGVSLEEKYLLPLNEFAAHGGAFPVTVRGAGVIGSVTVSGLPQIDDHELVVSVLEQQLATTQA
ncbi:heme-degrading domain-containing protein [Granulosicoccus sp. 3-233]|uniref:heme-degrading domain-containing protein n=1 Tax=Granulosicoccus sp. 3-233 TaxID=3417969 RepID=UPI003D34BFB6